MYQSLVGIVRNQGKPGVLLQLRISVAFWDSVARIPPTPEINHWYRRQYSQCKTEHDFPAGREARYAAEAIGSRLRELAEHLGILDGLLTFQAGLGRLRRATSVRDMSWACSAKSVATP